MTQPRRETVLRPWFAICQYEGLKPFYFGTVWARVDATHQEVEDLALALLDEHMPSRPKITALQPGQIVLLPDEEREAA